ALPMVCVLAGMAGAYVYATHSQRRLWIVPLVYLAGAAPLLVANAVICAMTGVWHDFWMAYVVTNGRYADFGGTLLTDLPVFTEYLTNTLDVRYFLFTFLG